jgi:hypothetical protein
MRGCTSSALRACPPARPAPGNAAAPATRASAPDARTHGCPTPISAIVSPAAGETGRGARQGVSTLNPDFDAIELAALDEGNVQVIAELVEVLGSEF